MEATGAFKAAIDLIRFVTDKDDSEAHTEDGSWEARVNASSQETLVPLRDDRDLEEIVWG